MEHSDTFTLAEDNLDFITMDRFLDLSNLSTSLGQPEVDDRLVTLVDSPQGSPLSNEPPSPSLTDSDAPVHSVLSIPESDSFHFDFGFVDDDATMYRLEKEILGQKPEMDHDMKEETSLEAWLSDPNSAAFIENISSEQANNLLVEAASAADLLQTAVVSSSALDNVEEEPSASTIIDDHELISLSVRDLNRRLSKYSKDVQQELKRRRRTLKNRGYAQNCRTKRIKDKAELEKENDDLVQQLQVAQKNLSEMSRVKKENAALQAELKRVRDEVIRLRASNQRPDQWLTSSTASSQESQW